MNVLWLCNVDLRIIDGASIRYANYARRLTAAGHNLHFLVPHWAYNDEAAQRIHAETGATCSRLQAYLVKGLWGALSAAVVVPSWRHRLLRSQRAPFVAAVKQAVRDRNIDVLILGERMHVFVLEEGILDEVAVVADLTDYMPLMELRYLAACAKSLDFRSVPWHASQLYRGFVQDRYIASRADATILVGPEDAAFARRLGGRRIEVLFNGVDVPDLPPEPKVPARIVFPGTMSYKPNWESALWFIDKVLPKVRARRPDAVFVAAGSSPVPALQARAGDGVVVTGRVPNLLLEISRGTVCAVPMISGSGFKNKVVEGMAAGTYVVGTRYASEFLPPDLKACMTTAHGAAELAGEIVKVIDNPQAYSGAVEKARSILRARLTWDQQTRALEHILHTAHGRFLDRRAKTVGPQNSDSGSAGRPSKARGAGA